LPIPIRHPIRERVHVQMNRLGIDAIQRACAGDRAGTCAGN
jgi:hypothetical protein